MAGKGHNFVLLLVEVSMQAEGERGNVVALDVMLRRLVARDVCSLEEGSHLCFQFIVEVVVLGLVVARAPVVQVAVYAVLNLDMHQRSNNFINVTNPPRAYSRPPPSLSSTNFVQLTPTIPHFLPIPSPPPILYIFS